MQREIYASWTRVLMAFACTVVALGATVARQPRKLSSFALSALNLCSPTYHFAESLEYFALYFSGTAFIFGITFWRVSVLKMVLYAIKYGSWVVPDRSPLVFP